MNTLIDPKAMARQLRARMNADGMTVTHSQALELVAASLGYRDWNTAAAATTASASALPGAGAGAGAAEPTTIPILRTFPGPEADRFYVDYLGFSVDWEHRFEDGMPLYRQVSRAGCVLHLSEHHGDATPGSAVRILVADARRLQRELKDNDIYPLRIGLKHEEWGDEVAIPDPFGNRLIFHSPAS